MGSKKEKFIIFLFIFVMIGVFIYFLVFLFWTNFAGLDYNDTFDSKEIRINKTDYDGDYLYFNNFKIANRDNLFTLKSSHKNNNVYLTSDNEKIIVIGEGSPNYFINIFKNIGDNFSVFKESFIDKYIINDVSLKAKSILSDKNINDDFELLSYIKDYNSKKSINISVLKENVVVSSYIRIISDTDVIFVNGYYDGFIIDAIIDGKYNKELYIKKDDKYYYVQFISNERINNNYIYDMISTIEF